MIKRVRRKFILIGTAATSAAILALILSINLAHISMEERKLDGVVEELAEELADSLFDYDYKWVGTSEVLGESAGRCVTNSSGNGSGIENGAASGSADGGQLDGKSRTGREGELPRKIQSGRTGQRNQGGQRSRGNGREKNRRGRQSASVQYSGRFFGALLTRDGNIVPVLKNEEILSEMDLSELVEDVQKTARQKGYVDEFRYLVREIDGEIRSGGTVISDTDIVFDTDAAGGTGAEDGDVGKNDRREAGGFKGNAGAEDGDVLICFLDCSTDLQDRRMLWIVSAVAGSAGLLFSFLFIFFLSERNVRPIREAMDRQKRFITDAGHELKTPLSVIGTNMELLHMDLGENEWVDSTRRQVKKLRRLVTDLISLSKIDEMKEGPEKKVFCVSNAAAECVAPFEEMGLMRGKTIRTDIAEGIFVEGDEQSVRQLFTILCDNALKYSTGDDVCVRLYREGGRAVFEASNDWDRNTPPEKLDRLFDRFYRGDASRSGARGEGFGLGLSIAGAIAERDGLRIRAFEDAAQRIVFRVTF